MTNEAKKIARLRLLKRIGIIGLITSGAIGLVFLILSLLPQGNAAFTIRIDDPAEVQTFKMFSTAEDAQNNKDSKTYMSAKPMTSTKPTDVGVVTKYLASLENKEGSQNLIEDKENENKTQHELAMVYTVYLANTSDEEIDIRYMVNLDAYKQPDNTSAAPIEYFRILVQTQIDNEPVSERFYAQKRSPKFSYVPTDCEDKDQTREPISWDKDWDENGEVYLKSKYKSNGNDGYCLNFNDYEFKSDIVNEQISIPVGKTLRYTFVAYFADDDLDNGGNAPENSYLLLSLHFGV